jgi:hypothetical protein
VWKPIAQWRICSATTRCRKIQRCAFLIALVAAAASLTGCGGGIGASLNAPIPCLFNGQSQLVYPIPGATGVPDAPQQIAFATSRLFPSTFEARVNNDPNPNAATGGAGAFFQHINQAQVPQPSATPAFSNALYESAMISASFSHGTYYVFLNDTLGGCTPTSAGSFTTQ